MPDRPPNSSAPSATSAVNEQLPLFSELTELSRDLRSAVQELKGASLRDRRRKLAKYPENMTVQQVADYLNCEADHVTHLYDEGKLAGKNIASPNAKKRCLRFTRDSVAAYETQAAQRDFSTTPNRNPNPNHP